MFIEKKLCTVLVSICMVVVCEANSYSDYLNDHYNDYATKVSSYIRKAGDYIDPHPTHNDEPPKKKSPPNVDQTFYDPKTSDGNRISDTNSCYEELRKCWLTKSNDITDVTGSRRIINMLLTRATVKEEGSILKRYIVMETSLSEQEALKKFGLGELKFREIDPILNKAIKTPESYGFFDYVLIIYRLMRRSADLVFHYKGIVVSIIVLVSLCVSLLNIRWDFGIILFASIKVYLTVTFLISWWKVLNKGPEDLPIQCQPEKMRWTDKAMTWFYHYDCDKYYEAQTKASLLEKEPVEEFLDAVKEALVGMLILSRTFFYWTPTFVTKCLPLIIFLISLLLSLSIMILLFSSLVTALHTLPEMSRKTYAMIKKNILEFVRYLQIQYDAITMNFDKLHNPPVKNEPKNGNKNRLSGKNTYYKIACGIGRSVILKIKAGAKSMEKNELETKICSILGKSMEVEKILGRMATMYGEQVTVAMKRKQDKEEIIQRWEELRDNGIFVEEDIILLDEVARWNMLGLRDEQGVQEESRKMCINGEEWIWNDETRKWVENKPAEEPENSKNSIAEVKS